MGTVVKVLLFSDIT